MCGRETLSDLFKRVSFSLSLFLWYFVYISYRILRMSELNHDRENEFSDKNICYELVRNILDRLVVLVPEL